MKPAVQRVSVVIAALNVLDVIDVQLDALAAQDYSGDFEVVIADNGSTDGLRAHIESHPLAERLALTWVDASGAKGVSHARNVGVAKSTGNYIAFCDADDRVDGSWLRLLVSTAAEFDAVGGGLDGEPLSSARAFAARPLSIIDKQPSTANATLPWVGGGNMGIWRSAFEQVGGWDETYLYALEDMDLSWKIQLAGMTLAWRPDALVAYRMRDDLASLCRQSFNYGRGEVQLYQNYRDKCMSGRPFYYLVVMLVLIVIRNPLLPTWLTRLPRGQWVWHVYALFGRVRGSIEYKVFYV